MRFFGMEPLGTGPVRFYDIQKLFSIAYEDQKSRRSLEYAVDFLNIEKDGAFHRALSDAWYTARVLQMIKDPVALQTGAQRRMVYGEGAPDDKRPGCPAEIFI